MIEKLNNESMSEQPCTTAELTDNELAYVAGGIVDDGTGQTGFCGTKPPGWHPPVLHRS
jgi:hypothetical protein